mmetsp:Transcript_18894/g.46381  ORF Transcript_18894/g.46381 Transcript_18894/m.46381 type:complete len:212 (-) Transcript_18894:905-1540(-)
MWCAAHSTPNTCVSLRRFSIAASRIVYTLSASHVMHIFARRSSKNWTPIWLASSGMCSMIARRTRHCLSSASSIMAGSSDCDSESTPMTLFTLSSLLIMLSRASWCSSLSSERKSGTSCSIVWFLPKTGASPMMTDASAARTCCDGSTARSRTHGIRCCSVTSTLTRSQKPVTLKAAAVRTSGSESLRNLTSAPVISASITSLGTVSHSSQ